MRLIKSFHWPIFEASLIVLFWLQGSRVLFSALFGVVYDAIFDQEVAMLTLGILFVLVIAAFTLPFLLKRTFAKILPSLVGRKGLFLSVLLAAVVRIPMTLSDPQIRLVSAILLIGVTNCYLALLISNKSLLVPISLALGLVLDQITRVFGYTWDLTLQPSFISFQVLISLAMISIGWTVYNRRARDPLERRGGSLESFGGVGLGAFLFLETSILAQPNVLARWSGESLEIATPALLFATVFPLFYLGGDEYQRYGGRLLQVFAGWGSLVRALFLTISVALPLILGWHLDGLIGLALLLFAQLILVSSLPLLLGFSNLNQNQDGEPIVALGMIFFFILHLLYAFSFTYPYTFSILRNTGPLIIGIGALGALFPMIWRSPENLSCRPFSVNNDIVVGFSLILAVVIIKSAPSAVVAPANLDSIRVATYNIHYGFDSEWYYSLAQQASTIEASEADIIFLQEVDTGRPTSYGVDTAYWLAWRLGMHQVFAPALEGLSGIALLTRLPILESDWQLLPSELEQTALVWARLNWQGDEIMAYGTWLGLEEEEQLGQIDAALDTIGNSSFVVFGGDLNSTPDSRVYRTIKTAGFDDPFLQTGNLPAPTDPAINPQKRIDYVWSRGTQPRAANVSRSTASDHRLVVVELEKPD